MQHATYPACRDIHACSRSANNRGAVFLLSIYLMSLMLLLLSTTALQRTTTDLRASQLSSAQQQAFWLAESGLDQALAGIRNRQPLPYAATTVNALTGSSAYAASVDSSIDVNQDKTQFGALQGLQQITSTGTTLNGRSATVTGHVFGPIGLQGIWANRLISVFHAVVGGGSMHVPVFIAGDIHSAWGEAPTVIVDGGVTIYGSIVIGPPSAAGANIPYPFNGAVQLQPYSTLNLMPTALALPFTAGVIQLQQSVTGGLAAARVTGRVASGPVPFLPAAPLPSNGCSPSPWVIPDGATYEVHPGVRLNPGDPLHVAQANADGNMVICVPSVDIGKGAHVTFHQPTVVYVTSQISAPHYPGGAFINNGTVLVDPPLQQRSDHGLVIVGSTASESSSGLIFPGIFEGSVYAPGSSVNLGANNDEINQLSSPAVRKLGYVVADAMSVSASCDFTPPPAVSGKFSSSETPLLSWTN